MAHWTTDDIPDQSGRTAVVTGANSGVGFATALELARHGAQVVAAGRSADSGKAAVDDLRRRAAGSTVEWAQLDLADLSSVRRFADEFAARQETLDLLINNAGWAFGPYQRTVDGFEMAFGVNHLGHFALTGLLLPLLLAKPDARVVTVGSGSHEWRTARIDFDDLLFEHDYKRGTAYARSKMANMLFAQELHRRLTAAARTQRSVTVDPGVTRTNLGPRFPGRRIITLLTAPMAHSAAVGAAPTLYAATAPDAHGGEFFHPERKGGPPVRAQAAPAVYDEESARRLWQVSEQLTGVSFDAGSAGR